MEPVILNQSSYKKASEKLKYLSNRDYSLWREKTYKTYFTFCRWRDKGFKESKVKVFEFPFFFVII